MYVIERKTGAHKEIIIIRIHNDKELLKFTTKEFFFNWHTEKENTVFKLMLREDYKVLGLVSIKHIIREERLEINLLSTSRENRGKDKIYELIAVNLIAHVCREAIKMYGEKAYVSLLPKTILKEHYILQYGFRVAGKHLYLAGKPLFELLKEFEI